MNATRQDTAVQLCRTEAEANTIRDIQDAGPSSEASSGNPETRRKKENREMNISRKMHFVSSKEKEIKQRPERNVRSNSSSSSRNSARLLTFTTKGDVISEDKKKIKKSESRSSITISTRTVESETRETPATLGGIKEKRTKEKKGDCCCWS